MCTYSVGKTVYNTAYVGDQDCSLKKGRTSQTTDFNHDIDILETAIYNYDRYYA